MSTAREIRTKIGSIKSTQKITRAMELVAVSKMRKAQDRMAMSRPYAQKIRRVIAHVAASHAEYQHPYMKQHDNITRVGFIVITTDRGLCGGLNINLFRNALMGMKEWDDKNVEIDLCIIGRKGEVYFGQQGANILGSVTHIGDKPTLQDIIGVVKILLKQYDEEKLDRIYVCANEFVNVMTQKPFVRQLLPLQKESEPLQTDTEKFLATNDINSHWDYLYEPDSAKTLLTMLLVRYIESQVYQAVIENIACEQAARMVAMKNATQNAKEIINELQLAFNKARQAGITREIAEIVAGAAALE
ncbi:MAG: F0F1 ATP synthase subunit gamma [Gammaproteobacteria bacterium CG_4_10_14_0_8_um_filter_38_16]|nr:MAG: F0F1 ATP synthase subunit gamma [Gammaproteobacteria bacterium CG_4_10_14_0_8_um_filter_38_16]PJA03951.1 MAG: F0F1 ATP synthase subunit gamma [Gammaproteobacteria bacterium CG_4_10_14_0_2_um_filter_38_22]PJB09722.1 MAG: F0F1 ATP synthase subunit gamma [Gammaproteobacteria bacterium CG_4_9_14_3_um_filter_38_9]